MYTLYIVYIGVYMCPNELSQGSACNMHAV